MQFLLDYLQIIENSYTFLKRELKREKKIQESIWLNILEIIAIKSVNE